MLPSLDEIRRRRSGEHAFGPLDFDEACNAGTSTDEALRTGSVRMQVYIYDSLREREAPWAEEILRWNIAGECQACGVGTCTPQCHRCGRTPTPRRSYFRVHWTHADGRVEITREFIDAEPCYGVPGKGGLIIVPLC